MDTRKRKTVSSQTLTIVVAWTIIMLTPRNVYTIAIFTTLLGFILQTRILEPTRTRRLSIHEVESEVMRLIPDQRARLQWYKARAEEMSRVAK
jgi:hypothetical protein